MHLNKDLDNFHKREQRLVAMFTFFLQGSKICACLEQHSTSFDRLAYLDWHFMELGFMLTELAGDGECRLALLHVIRNFLANEIYHFSRVSHQTSCIFTWAALSIELAPY